MSARGAGRRHLWRSCATTIAMSPGDVKGRLEELVEEGELLPVKVEGWKRRPIRTAARACRGRSMPRRCWRPFDPLVFERLARRAAFDFFTASRSYTPAEKRQYGYYAAVPARRHDRCADRVGGKDRPAGMLRVLATFAQPGGAARDGRRTAGEEFKLMQPASAGAHGGRAEGAIRAGRWRRLPAERGSGPATAASRARCHQSEAEEVVAT